MHFPDLAPYAGLIFDLDGTLIDSMPVHVKAWQEIGRSRGFDLPAHLIYDWGGVTSRDVVVRLAQAGYRVGGVDSFVAEKLAAYREHLAEIRTFPAVERVLRAAHARGAKIAVGTGTQRVNARDILALLGLRGLVTAVVAAEDVPRHKPYPDTFVTAAARLQLPPRACAVFEDGPLGVKAALAGGFDCVEMLNGTCVGFHLAAAGEGPAGRVPPPAP